MATIKLSEMTKPIKITLGPRYFLASKETIIGMEETWYKLYPDKPFSINAWMSEIMRGTGEK